MIVAHRGDFMHVVQEEWGLLCERCLKWEWEWDSDEWKLYINSENNDF